MGAAYSVLVTGVFMAALGGLLAYFLAIANKRLYVYEDPRIEQIEELFAVTSVPDGYGYFGVTGAGHFVKMVHNAIEYGMMHSLAEGMELLKNGPSWSGNVNKQPSEVNLSVSFH